jgi:hypothetical protein
MLGYEGKVWPTANITRQDAFVMIARALEIQPVSGYTIQAADAGDISDYAKASFAAMVSLGMVNGRDDGKLYPKDTITRAEVVQVLDNIVGTIYSAAGTYTKDATGYVVINTPDVQLKDMTINGSLVIAPGVGEGDCTLDNVDVTGSVVVLGGGTHSVKFINQSSVGESVVVRKVDGEVHLFYENGTEVPNTYIPDGSNNVSLEGAFDKVTVDADTTVTLGTGTTVADLTLNSSATVAGSGTVTNATVAATVTGTVSLSGTFKSVDVKAAATVTVPTGATVESMKIEAQASITGAGTITSATVTATASGTTFETKPATTEVAAGATATVAGETMDSTNDDVADTGSTGGEDSGTTAVTVSEVRLYFSDGTSTTAALSGTTATFSLTMRRSIPARLQSAA